MKRDWAHELCEYYINDSPALPHAVISDPDTDELPIVHSVTTTKSKPENINVPKLSPLALAMLLVIALGSIAGLGLVFTGMSQQPVPAQQVQHCLNEPLADRTTPAGVVVAFQHAYFSRDTAGVEAVISQESPLTTVKWEDVFAKQEFTACVQIQHQTAHSVDAQTTIEIPEQNKKMVYTQRFSMRLGEIGPRIETIVDIEPTIGDQ